MGLKTKHSKQLKKVRAKRDADRKTREPEIDFDTSAYVIYNRLQMTYPSLSFDIVKDNYAQDVTKFPLSLHMIAGAQTPPHVENNYIYVMKVANIKPLKQEKDDPVDEDESEKEEEDESEDMPNLTSVRVLHKGCVNRLRVNKMNGKTYTASWSDRGKVHIYDLTTSVQACADLRAINTYTAQKVDPKPIFTFGGHLSEGYSMDWSPLSPGTLATGDCKKAIHIWTMRSTDWHIDQKPLIGHENSVEDIRWSPEDSNVLASCSVDKSIRIWDLRETAVARCVTQITQSHKSDVNVIDWNTKSRNLIVSGGDDGVVKVWDNRFFQKKDQDAFPVAQFHYHKKPITSVQWCPHDDTVMAVASEDDRLTLWDLAVEKDDEQEQEDLATNGMDIDNEVRMKGEKDEKMEKESGDDDTSSSTSSSSDDEDEEEDEMMDNNGDHEDELEDEEKEDDENEIDDIDGVDYGELNFKTIPEQMLFLHQGQAEIKELHWHPQLNGIIISTALNGINIFKTISA